MTPPVAVRSLSRSDLDHLTDRVFANMVRRGIAKSLRIGVQAMGPAERAEFLRDLMPKTKNAKAPRTSYR